MMFACTAWQSVLGEDVSAASAAGLLRAADGDVGRALEAHFETAAYVASRGGGSFTQGRVAPAAPRSRKSSQNPKSPGSTPSSPKAKGAPTSGGKRKAASGAAAKDGKPGDSKKAKVVGASQRAITAFFAASPRAPTLKAETGYPEAEARRPLEDKHIPEQPGGAGGGSRPGSETHKGSVAAAVVGIGGDAAAQQAPAAAAGGPGSRGASGMPEAVRTSEEAGCDEVYGKAKAAPADARAGPDGVKAEPDAQAQPSNLGARGASAVELQGECRQGSSVPQSAEDALEEALDGRVPAPPAPQPQEALLLRPARLRPPPPEPQKGMKAAASKGASARPAAARAGKFGRGPTASGRKSTDGDVGVAAEPGAPAAPVQAAPQGAAASEADKPPEGPAAAAAGTEASTAVGADPAAGAGASAAPGAEVEAAAHTAGERRAFAPAAPAAGAVLGAVLAAGGGADAVCTWAAGQPAPYLHVARTLRARSLFFFLMICPASFCQPNVSGTYFNDL